MSEVIQVIMNKDELQPLADSIKTLSESGSTSKLTLAQMEAALEAANAEIAEQTSLINQIMEKLGLSS